MLSQEKAQALKEAGPAVQAGVFRVVTLPWMALSGAMTLSRRHLPRPAAEASGT